MKIKNFCLIFLLLINSSFQRNFWQCTKNFFFIEEKIIKNNKIIIIKKINPIKIICTAFSLLIICKLLAISLDNSSIDLKERFETQATKEQLTKTPELETEKAKKIEEPDCKDIKKQNCNKKESEIFTTSENLYSIDFKENLTNEATQEQSTKKPELEEKKTKLQTKETKEAKDILTECKNEKQKESETPTEKENLQQKNTKSLSENNKSAKKTMAIFTRVLGLNSSYKNYDKVK